MIIYGVYKKSSNTIMKGIRIENMGNARNEYKKPLEDGWEEDKYFGRYFKDKNLLSNSVRKD